MNPQIDWNYSGKPDALMGTGAARAEKVLAYSAGLLVPLALILLGFKGYVQWAWWQWIIALAIGADISAGAVANALNSCKRFYHSPLQPGEEKYRLVKNPVLFSAMHIYPLIVWLVFDRANWIFGVVWYTLLVLCAWLVGQVPLFLRRPAAVMIIVFVLLVNAYLIQPIPGFEWLAPLLFIKIVLSHAVREEPYRPA